MAIQTKPLTQPRTKISSKTSKTSTKTKAVNRKKQICKVHFDHSPKCPATPLSFLKSILYSHYNSLITDNHKTTISTTSTEKESSEKKENVQREDFFHSEILPQISIQCFINRLLTYMTCSHSCFILATIYLHRLYPSTNSSICLSKYNFYRAFAVAVAVAAKFSDDTFRSNYYYARVTGLEVEEFSELELLFLDKLEWRLVVEEGEYSEMVRRLCREAGVCRSLEKRAGRFLLGGGGDDEGLRKEEMKKEGGRSGKMVKVEVVKSEGKLEKGKSSSGSGDSLESTESSTDSLDSNDEEEGSSKEKKEGNNYSPKSIMSGFLGLSLKRKRKKSKKSRKKDLTPFESMENLVPSKYRIGRQHYY